MINLKRARYFWLVAESGTQQAAATKNFISQSALSRAIGLLEKELGVKLFLPDGQCNQLTTAGRTLADALGVAYRTIAKAVEDITTGGSLAVGALPSLARNLEGIIGRLAASYPNVAVRVEAPVDPNSLARLVRSGVIEVGLTEHIVAVNVGLEEVLLGDEELVIAFPPGTKVEDREIPISSLGDTRFVVTPEGSSLRTHYDQGFSDANTSRNIVRVTAVRSEIPRAVAAGVGAALLNPSLAEEAEALGAICCRTIPPTIRTLVLVRRPGAQSPVVSRLIEVGRD